LCNADEYRNADRCCQMCPAGEYVQEPCVSPHTQGKCVTCDPGTFTAHANGLDSCLVCYSCRDDQEMVQECSPTSNRMCQCKTGHFYQDPGTLEFCMPCDKCSEGIPALRECSATSNTVCGMAHQ
uniref:TNFR-Cys domain-containing protein n=1 Tax=Chinchilla lanigera TaxID=34839 RepID=A0A8C2W0X5_CHILA